MIEQRVSPRIPIELSVKLVYKMDNTCMARIVSMNLGGFLCDTRRNIPLDSVVDITMLVPDKAEDNDEQLLTKVSARGKVVRDKIIPSKKGAPEHVVAVKFTEFDDKDKKILYSYIEYATELHLN